MLYLMGHQQLVMRCGFLLVEGCMVTCLEFNSEDYSYAICWSEMPEGKKVCCKENSERCHSRMPVNIIFLVTCLVFNSEDYSCVIC
jgi:hypothetical protein